VIALLQGVTELFPVSSLGHSVLVPAWLGGSWQRLVTQSSQGDSGSSFYLAFIVSLHVATAVALLLFFRRDWVRIIGAFVRSARRSLVERRLSVRDTDEKLAWLIVFATVPVGITGLALEHVFRTLFAKPLAASVFLFVNGLLLLAAERLRRTTATARKTGVSASVERRVAGMIPVSAAVAVSPTGLLTAGVGGAVAVESVADDGLASDERLARLSWGSGVAIGSFQVLALLAGISRSGVTMAGGLWRGLSHEDAARFAFLLATPVIFAAGVLKLPSLAGPAAANIHGQIAVGFVVAGVAAYLSVRYLTRYFTTRTLTPFAVYCLLAGAASVLRFAFVG
jgi:undecaprenyl-diphosphatase